MTIKTTSLFWFLCLLALFLSACGAVSPSPGIEVTIDGGNYRVVSVEELTVMLEDKDFTMANVHIPWQGDIPDTDLQLPYDQINDSLDQLPADKDTKILVYCLTSGMAKIAAESLVGSGYTDVWMLEGGTTAWTEGGLPLETE